MNHSSKIAMSLGAAMCCGAIIFASISGQARPAAVQTHPAVQAHPASRPTGSAARFSGAHPLHQGHPERISREQFRRAIDHRFRRGQYGWGYGAGSYYYDGSYDSGPREQGIFEDQPDDSEAYIPRRPRCVVPLLIELGPRRRSAHLPRVTYGGPAFCPPPVIAENR